MKLKLVESALGPFIFFWPDAFFRPDTEGAYGRLNNTHKYFISINSLLGWKKVFKSDCFIHFLRSNKGEKFIQIMKKTTGTQWDHAAFFKLY